MQTGRQLTYPQKINVGILAGAQGLQLLGSCCLVPEGGMHLEAHEGHRDVAGLCLLCNVYVVQRPAGGLEVYMHVWARSSEKVGSTRREGCS